MELSSFAQAVYAQKYQQGEEEWPDTVRRVVDAVMRPHLPELADEMTQIITDRKFIPAGRYLYAAGKRYPQINNCYLATVEDSREAWADLGSRAFTVLMTGAGLGVVYSKIRPRGAPVGGMGGTATGPCSLMLAINEIGRQVQQGGSRRSAMIALLHWNHPDVKEFIHLKDWPDDIKAAKARDFNAWAPMDMTNISVILDDAFFEVYCDSEHPMHDWAHEVYWDVVNSMLRTGEPGFSVDVGPNAGEHLRNPCSEITSQDDNDVCNLGSVNLARIDTLEEFSRVVELATAFLLCGTLYSVLPTEASYKVRERNRRIGLGLMGGAEWLAKRGKSFGPDSELAEWMNEYSLNGWHSLKYARRLGVATPIKSRAEAPAGSIAIIGETSSGWEPFFAPAYKRRFLKGTEWHWQYVVERWAKNLDEQGIDPDTIETAYSLAEDPERRIAFQAWLQKYIDQGISSTINLPAFEEQKFTPEEFGNALIKYLPHLRGITVYPDGSRGGQPLTVVPYAEAVEWEGYEFAEVGNEQSCVNGVCGV